MAQSGTTAPPQPEVTTSPPAKTSQAELTETLIVDPSDDTTIRPFQFHASDEELAELKRRILATRWPDRETVNDDTQGVQLATMQKLADYWATEYDWRKIEARINSYPNFITNIDGLDIHFIHVKSKHEGALPIIVTHGWPGSVIEQLKIIEPLTDPTTFGGTAADAFDVVIPSIPGYGFTERPAQVGWNPPRIVNAWITLMKRLGYSRFVAQGGDWGAIITEIMGAVAPPELAAIHTNMPSTVPPEILEALRSGKGPPSSVTEGERQAFDRLAFFNTHGLAYSQEMGQRPQTLYGIADSPVGLAAWFLDHDQRSYQMISRAFQGEAEGLTRDDVLDNITIAWLTNTGVSGGRLYWEALPRDSAGYGVWENHAPFFAIIGPKVPVAVSIFPDELYPAPRNWAERAYPNLIYFNQVPKGGHFAAFEQPEFLVNEMRAGFRSLR